MVDISESKMKQMTGKNWDYWDLPTSATEDDSASLREAFKPKEPDRPRDQCNLLPRSFLSLCGTKPEVEYFSVTKCPACRCVMKSQWMLRHFKRNHEYNLVCRRTEMIVQGNKCLAKSGHPLYDIREAEKYPLSNISATSTVSHAKAKISRSPALVASVTIPKLSPPQKHSSHKTEPSTTSSSSSKSKSNSSSSHSKKHSSSSSSQSTSSNKHHKSSKNLSPSNSSWSSSSNKKDSSSSKSHKSHNTASYVLSIPSDDSSHNESVESILLSNSAKQTMHIITGKSKSTEPEYEQLKFYADSSDKRSKAAGEAAESRSHKLHFSPQLENFKIPLKNKPLASGTSSSSDASKKSKSSSSHNHSTKAANNDSGSKISVRHISSSGSSSSSKPVPSLTIISEAPKMNTILIAPHTIAEVKDKSSNHSKKKKKKKSRDEPRKIIPLKERAFNPDQHCGVVVSDAALPCTRSLTCKTHSIALRRAVPGRSHQFDSLLATHKKARDEEKAKTKETVEDSKSKAKKVNISTPVPADSDSSSSSLPQPPSVGKGNSSSVSAGKPLPTSLTFHTNSLSDFSSNNNVKHGGVGNANPVSKTLSSNPPSIRQQIPKAVAPTKTMNRPVIIVEEKKEAQGMSLFELGREPENKFVYVTRLEAPKSFGNIKCLETKTSRSNALSEWNPLDRFSRKGVIGGVKKKGFKDPMVSLLPLKIGSSESIVVDAQGKEVHSSTGDSDLVDATEGKTTASATSGRTKNSSKRKSSADSGMGSFAKKSRVIPSSQQFFEPVLFKMSEKPECTTKLSPAPRRLTEALADEHTDLAPEIVIDEDDDDYSFDDDLSIEARDFIKDYVKAHGGQEAFDKLSEEKCQRALDSLISLVV